VAGLYPRRSQLPENEKARDHQILTEASPVHHDFAGPPD